MWWRGECRFFVKTARLEPLIREFFHQTLERHARTEAAIEVRVPTVSIKPPMCCLLRHGDKSSPLAVLVQATVM